MSAGQAQLEYTTREMMRRLREGCHSGCDYDEAEGGIINHCPNCCTKITRDAYTLFVMSDLPIVQVLKSK
jgi:hypothetical protein